MCRERLAGPRWAEERRGGWTIKISWRSLKMACFPVRSTNIFPSTNIIKSGLTAAELMLWHDVEMINDARIGC
ncbi:hypothetical protein chiPu_0016219 [Chiloscyllium punctatum]|uniref:Uncharacterized protein n=1 Tax=Chiloscyllium punctatum TaxID=137246 RepID=A0A401T4W5_CHIPU|nr:hypothetical protein [Chiloscyllium punctatum]